MLGGVVVGEEKRASRLPFELHLDDWHCYRSTNLNSLTHHITDLNKPKYTLYIIKWC